VTGVLELFVTHAPTTSASKMNTAILIFTLIVIVVLKFQS